METIKEALTFDDVTLAPNYSEILPSEVNTSINLTENLNNLTSEFRNNELVIEVINFIEKDKKRPICTPFSK